MPRWLWRSPKRIGLCLAPLLLLTQVKTGLTAAIPAQEAVKEVWLAVHVNQQDLRDTALFLRRPDGRLLARAEDLRRWRLHVPSVASLSHQGEAYYPLAALVDLSYRVDEPRQAVFLDGPPQVFQPTVIRESAAGLTGPTPPRWGPSSTMMSSPNTRRAGR
jgi:hypothetical protein